MLRCKLERLENQKNVYWKQRAMAHWLQNEDRNTSFFHVCALERRKVNLIKSLKNNDGGVEEGEEELITLIANYYKQLFSSCAGTREAEILDKDSPIATSEMDVFLMRAFTMEEIKGTLNSMGD